MSFRRESSRDHYDAVVIGSGIGGLTAAARLTTGGASVLVLERHDRPGGYAHSFRRKGYLFDAAIHLTSGCEPTSFAGGALLHELLESLGVRDMCEFVRIDPLYRAVYPELSIDVPADPRGFAAAHARHFPEQAKDVEALLELGSQLRREAADADLGDGPRERGALARLPVLTRFHRSTLGQVLETALAEPRLRGVYATLWPFLGLPPSRLSFVYWSAMLAGYLEDGAYYCKGSFGQLGRALVAGIRRHGGEVLYRTRARRIRVERGRAVGVTLENGQRITADTIVSNADARQTFEELVGVQHLPPSLAHSLSKLQPSLSAFVAYLATDLDLSARGLGHETFFYASLDHEQNWRRTCAGDVAWFSATIPTLADPSLAPPGRHIILLTTLAPYHAPEAWRQLKPRFLESLLERVEEQIPGLRERLLHVEAGSPRTMERYTLNADGASYGWAASPDQVGPARLAARTPVAGLFLAGHWTRPGGGLYAAALSGARTAEEIVGELRYIGACSSDGAIG